MSGKDNPKTSTWQSIRRLLRLSGRNQVWLYIAIATAVLGTGFTIAWNFSLARFIDAVAAGQFDLFVRNLLFTVIFIAAGIPVDFLRARSIGLFSERTLAGLREKIAAQATVLPMRYLEERHTGDLLAVVDSDLAKVKQMTASSLLEVVSQSVMAVAALAALFVISWQLALASTLLMPLMFAVMSRLNQPIARRAGEVQQAVGETISVAQDGLGGLMVTKAFNLAAVMDGRFRQANQQALSKGLSLVRWRVAADGGGSIFGVLPFLLTFGLGGYLAITGSLSFGSLMAFINLLNFVANPLSSLPPAIAGVSEAAGATERMYRMLDQEPERAGGSDFPIKGQATAVRFERVSFAYGDEPVLKDVSFTVQPGQTVAVVGPSGGGKSTVLKLLLGFYPVQEQRIFLFGQDLSRWSLPAARKHMAFVAQDTYLFPVSMAENIACGKPGAGQDEIERAANMANIHDTIVSFPDGYGALAGERGARLSGGQRQRLSLARAILKDAPILLLDEPTSALDTESEALVQEALERFMAGRTTIVVAHRLSTIRDADVVLVLEEGRIVEQGTHEELMARGGRYTELYLRQFEETGLQA